MRHHLDATFERAKGSARIADLQSDLARYLCVLVSGYIEKALVVLVLEHARKKGAPTLQRFVEQRTKRFSAPNAHRIQWSCWAVSIRAGSGSLRSAWSMNGRTRSTVS